MRHHIDVQIRWADLDTLNHVNNVRLMEFFQDARIDLFSRGLPVDELSGLARDGEADAGFVMARQAVDYLAQIFLTDRTLSIDSTVQRLGRSSVTMRQIARNPKGVAVAQAEIVLVCVERSTGASQELPETWREFFTGYLDEEVA
jgi:acyl-CoA thioester hydrolase